MQLQVPSFSIYLKFDPLPPDEIPADYAFHDIEVLTLFFISGTIDTYCYLQELVLLVSIDAGTESADVRETFDEQDEEGLEVRVGGVGVRQFWDHRH
jgi:hypothetical protein